MAAAEPEQTDEPNRITVSMLRQADAMCPRRLHHEWTSGRKLSPLGGASFEVKNRVESDATTWHRGGVDAEAGRVAFPDPSDLAPEQRALYAACARGYLTLFPPVDAEVGDVDFTTDIAELDVRLSGPIGIPLHYDGRYELRVLRLGRIELDRADIGFTILRVAQWAPDTVDVVVFDPLLLQAEPMTINVADNLDDARSWLAERVDVIRSRADKHVAITGSSCRYCTCIPGCPKLSTTS